MSNSVLLWLTALGGLLWLLPGLNIFAFALLAFAAGTGTERVLAPATERKALR